MISYNSWKIFILLYPVAMILVLRETFLQERRFARIVIFCYWSFNILQFEPWVVNSVEIAISMDKCKDQRPCNLTNI